MSAPAKHGAGLPNESPVPAGDRQRRMRSIAIAVALAALVAMFYVVTLVKLGGNVAQRPF